MLSLAEKQSQIIQEFSPLSDWESRYKLLIQKGKKLPDLPENDKTEDAKVRGCQSQVWLHAKLNPEGRIEFRGDSDALLVKGLVAIILEIYSHERPQDILAFQPDFIQALGFDRNLSPSRTNGLFSMLKQIHHFALAFSLLQKK